MPQLAVALFVSTQCATTAPCADVEPAQSHVSCPASVYITYELPVLWRADTALRCASTRAHDAPAQDARSAADAADAALGTGRYCCSGRYCCRQR